MSARAAVRTGRIAWALLFSFFLAACTAETRRTDECGLLEPAEQELCMREVRDPKYEIEEERIEREEEARTPEERRRAECEALPEPELAECLAGKRSPDVPGDPER